MLKSWVSQIDGKHKSMGWTGSFPCKKKLSIQNPVQQKDLGDFVMDERGHEGPAMGRSTTFKKKNGGKPGNG